MLTFLYDSQLGILGGGKEMGCNSYREDNFYIFFFILVVQGHIHTISNSRSERLQHKTKTARGLPDRGYWAVFFRKWGVTLNPPDSLERNFFSELSKVLPTTYKKFRV